MLNLLLHPVTSRLQEIEKLLIVELYKKVIPSFTNVKFHCRVYPSPFPRSLPAVSATPVFNIVFLFYARDSGGELNGLFVMKANERLNDSAARCI